MSIVTVVIAQDWYNANIYMESAGDMIYRAEALELISEVSAFVCICQPPVKICQNFNICKNGVEYTQNIEKRVC